MHITPGIGYLSHSGCTSFFKYTDHESRDRSLEEMIAREQASSTKHAAQLERCDLQHLGWASPNRAAIETGCKTFDAQCGGVITGNVIANTFYSSYVRPRSKCDCNGMAFRSSALQEFDLKAFSSHCMHLSNVLRFIRQGERFWDEQTLLTAVFHWRGHGQSRARVMHGAVLTGADLKRIRRFDREDLGLARRDSSRGVMDVVTPLLTDAVALNREVVYRLN